MTRQNSDQFSVWLSPLRNFSLWEWGSVKLLAALVLLLAAAMKTHQLITVPVLGEGILQTRWFQIILVEFEFSFSLWLLVGFCPRLTRWGTALLFSAFFLVSFFKAIVGEESCGCFGTAKVNPWFTAALDLALAILSVIADQRPSVNRQSLKKRAILLAVLWPAASAALIYFAFLPFLGLDCAASAFDFGVSRQREDLTHTFELTNRSNRPITITSIKTSCGCMIPENEKELLGRSIESGQSVPLTIHLKTGLSRGKINKATLVRYRGSAASLRVGTLQLELSATVREDYTLDPPAVELGELDIPHDKPVISTVKLRNNIPETKNEPMKVLALKPSKNYISAQVVGETSEAIDLEIHVDLSGQTQTGQQDAYIVIETDSRSAPTAVLPIRWTAAAKVKLSADSIVIPSDALGNVTETVTVKTNAPSVIEAIVCDEQRIQCTREHDQEEGSDLEHKILIEIPETEGSLTGMARIRVRVKDDPSGGEEIYTAVLPIYRFARNETAEGSTEDGTEGSTEDSAVDSTEDSTEEGT